MGPERTSTGNGWFSFLSEAMALLGGRKLALPVALLAILLTVSNIVILSNPPGGGASPVPFILAAIVRVFGLIGFEAALLRLMLGGGRSPYRPDGAFWLFVLIVLGQIILSVALQRATRLGETVPELILANVLTTIALAPLAAWFAAAAVERPLAWDPRPWLSGFGRWLPQLIGWSLLLITPIAVLHAVLDRWLLAGAGTWFWLIALFDGPLSTLVAIIGLALNAAAYSRVARSGASRLSPSPANDRR